MQIITDKSKLGAHITRTMKSYHKVGEAVHIAVVSALHHVATTGDPIYLNAVMSGLRTNDTTAVKMYIRRVAAIVGLEGENPDGLPSEAVIAAVEHGGILTMEKGEFKTVKGHTSEAAKVTAKLCVSRFIKPDGKIDKLVLDRNNFAEVKTLGDQEILDKIIKLAAELDSESETKKIAVSDPVRKLVADFSEKAEVYRQQSSLAA